MTTRPAKVLFLMIDMAMGGSERLILNLASQLDRSRFAPVVAWLTARPALPEFRQLGIPLYSVPKRKSVDWTALRTLARIVRDESIDLVNAHHFMPLVQAWYAARLAERAGLVYTEHSAADVTAARGKWRTAGRFLLGSSDAVVGVSAEVSSTIVAHFGIQPGLVHTIDNGVDLGLFGGRGDGAAQVRARFGLSPADFVIGHVANFRRNKNHMFMVKAFERLAAERPSSRLVLAGQGFAGDPENSEPSVRAYVQERGLGDRVHFLGYQPDVHNILRMLDVFCLTSYQEGLPLSLIEAMASGLPVVATDIPALRALVEPDVNGWRTAPDDVLGLASALQRLADDRAMRQQMGAASRRRATERYSLQRCVQSTEQLFLSILERRARGARREPGATNDAVGASRFSPINMKEMQ